MSWVGFISPTQQPVGTRAGMVLLLLFSCQVMSNAWQHANGLQHARLPCPSLSPRICSNSCPLCRCCHPTISYSVTPFSSPQSFLASGSFPISQLFASGGQSIRASASSLVLPMNIQGWFPLGLIGLISLQSKELLRVFSSINSSTFSLLYGPILTSIHHY